MKCISSWSKLFVISHIKMGHKKGVKMHLVKDSLHFFSFYGIVHDISIRIPPVSSEGSDESVHMRRLSTTFSVRIHNVWM